MLSFIYRIHRKHNREEIKIHFHFLLSYMIYKGKGGACLKDEKLKESPWEWRTKRVMGKVFQINVYEMSQ